MTMDKPFIFEEAFNLLCGDKIGEGMTRTVYECKLHRDCVVKVEDPDSNYRQNWLEHQTWELAASIDGACKATRWLASIRWISPRGSILLMERTRPPSDADFAAVEKLPCWLTDLKRSNWGMVKSNKDGKEWLVCHDYGTNLCMQDGLVSKRMRKAEWSDS